MLALANGTAMAVAQAPRSHAHGAGSSFHHNLGGFRSGSAAIPFGIAGGGYFTAPNLPYVPNQFRGFNPFQELASGPLGPLLPQGQEGPGGMRLSQINPTRTSTAATPPRVANPTRADELVELGDRAFRGGNYKRASERYKLAAKANNNSPVPYLHLAQIAVFHSDYTAAAANLRDAITSTQTPQWLADAPDIQAMYGEPADFARQVARLESYLQTHPDDRDAWFVLGAQNYLSGHPQTATDALLRLTDRRPDPAVTALLDASTLALDRSRQLDSEPVR